MKPNKKIKQKDITNIPLKTNLKTINIINIKNKYYLKNQIFPEIKSEKNSKYLIRYNKKIIGFFSLNKDDFSLTNNTIYPALKISYFFIYKKYRLTELETFILQEIQKSLKTSKNKYKYLLLDTVIDKCMFYIKNGFDFYNINRNIKYNNKTVITMYKYI